MPPDETSNPLLFSLPMEATSDTDRSLAELIATYRPGPHSREEQLDEFLQWYLRQIS